MPKSKHKKAFRKPEAAIHPPFQRGKRLSREELQGLMESEDLVPIFVEFRLAEQKVGYMKNSERPDAAAREASATYTAQIVSQYLGKFLDTGARVRKGGKKGAQRRRINPEARKLYEEALIVRYVSQKRHGLKDIEIASNLRISGRKLTRIKAKHSEKLKTLRK